MGSRLRALYKTRGFFIKSCSTVAEQRGLVFLLLGGVVLRRIEDGALEDGSDGSGRFQELGDPLPVRVLRVPVEYRPKYFMISIVIIGP